MTMLHYTYKSATSPTALTKLNPTTVHPLTMTCLMLNCEPVSQTRCLSEFKLWNVKGKAKKLLTPIFAIRGQLANAAAIEADSRCQPRAGAAR